MQRIKVAVDQWNEYGVLLDQPRLVGSELEFLELAGDPSRNQVLVYASNDPEFQNRAKTTWYARQNGGICESVIQHILFPNKWVQHEVSYRMAAHELGHVLGLGHDDEESSVLYPKALDRPFEITKKQRRALCRVYGTCAKNP